MARQPGGGYVVYSPADSIYELPAEQAMVLANEDSVVFVGSAFETIASCHADHDRFVDALRTGAGVGWHEHDERLFSSVVRFFRPGYAAHVVDAWLPALDGVVDKREGASVPTWGCELGAFTVIMAQAFERSTPVGFDIHEPSIEAARKADVNQRARFDIVAAKDFPARATTSCVGSTPCTAWATRSGGSPHPPGPGPGRHAAAGRTERRRRPRARPEPDRANRLRPVHSHRHAGSLAQDVGLGLGALAGERQLTSVLREA